MADFNKFLPILLQNEGYYSNNKNDSGGETWRGISRNNYPNWSGWPMVDSYKGKPDFPHSLRADGELEKKVGAFYKASQWDKLYGDLIENQSQANQLIDWWVNAGQPAVKHLQSILGVTQDGKMGPDTLSTLNKADQETVFYKLQAARKQFYLDVISAHPEDIEFKSNWLERTASFKYTP